MTSPIFDTPMEYEIIKAISGHPRDYINIGEGYLKTLHWLYQDLSGEDRFMSFIMRLAL